MKKKIIIGIIFVILISGIIVYSILNRHPNSYDNGDINIIDNNTYEVTLNSDDIYITKAGTYNISGTLNNASVIVNVTKEEDVILVLDNVSITSKNEPGIYVKQANNVYIEFSGDNKIDSTTTSDLDAAIYSKDDLFLKGNGTLTITSNYDGIASKDDLVIESGTYDITSTGDGIKGRDSLTINDANFTINASDEGLKTTNEDEKGELIIEKGTFNITSKNDAISATSTLTILSGEYNIKTTSNTSTDSRKGIKSDINIIIKDGTFNIDTTDDSIHSNKDITLENGNFSLKSDDDAIHADGKLVINNGTYNITAHEGIEATYIQINNGDININASDDGINAANKSNDYTTQVEINGGDITIKMGAGDTDAIDSNGNLYINGGTINITAQSPFDYDGEAKYSGGTIIVNGETTNSITNQFGGQMVGGNRGMQPGGNMRGRMR